jgi:hypothetical protein
MRLTAEISMSSAWAAMAGGRAAPPLAACELGVAGGKAAQKSFAKIEGRFPAYRQPADDAVNIL